MKKYQMPNVTEERLESSLFIMDGTSGASGEITPPPVVPLPTGAPRHL